MNDLHKKIVDDESAEIELFHYKTGWLFLLSSRIFCVILLGDGVLENKTASLLGGHHNNFLRSSRF